MDQLITGTGNVEEIGVFICKMRETLLNCRSIQKNKFIRRQEVIVVVYYLFVCLIIVDNACEKGSSFHSDGSIFLLLLLLLCYERAGIWTSCPNLKILF